MPAGHNVTMRFGVYQFSPTLVPTLAALVMIALTVFLGDWQLNRAQEKRAMQARYDQMRQQPAVTLPAAQLRSEDVLYRKFELHGSFDPRHEIYLDNKLYQGVPGYHVITPFRDSASGAWVLVNRGWLRAGKDRARAPSARPVAGEVRLEGIAVSPRSRFLELSAVTVQGQVWQNLHFERYAAAVPYTLQPLLILQLNDSGDTLVRDWDRPDTGASMHAGYAIQWFAIATAILIIYISLNVKRRPAQ